MTGVRVPPIWKSLGAPYRSAPVNPSSPSIWTWCRVRTVYGSHIFDDDTTVNVKDCIPRLMESSQIFPASRITRPYTIVSENSFVSLTTSSTHDLNGATEVYDWSFVMLHPP
ncbi:hypothetical protein BD310DRAFT_501039 [Dichomitus squalens]|uniref:Uncharacterized protein n=1 Tax=Dichomitus squalens TaxID=114155 RepID=A0A4Q9PUM9_9APHY|nr:hypothetical protein BD310DRAFT_501039 [Dichomitus squalens]